MSSAQTAGATPATDAAGATPAAQPTNDDVDIVRLNLGQQPATPSTDAGATPTPSTTPATPTNDEQATSDKPKASDPAELRADLAGERKARQSAEAERDTAKGQLSAVLKALGLDKSAEQDPAVVAERATADALDARREVAVVRNAPRDARGNYAVDVNALLDSRSFMASIADVDPNDAEAIKAKIAAHAQAHPIAPAVRYGAGGGDVSRSGDPGNEQVDMDALIRGR